MCAWCINIVFKVNEYCFVASQYCCSNCVPMFNCESYVSTIFKLCTFPAILCTFTPPHIISQLCLIDQLCLNAITIMPTITITLLPTRCIHCKFQQSLQENKNLNITLKLKIFFCAKEIGKI